MAIVDIAVINKGVQVSRGLHLYLWGKSPAVQLNSRRAGLFLTLYTNNETEEREIKESNPFTIAPKSIRHLGINLTKEVKDLYPKNYRTLLKEIEEDTEMEKYSMLMDWKN